MRRKEQTLVNDIVLCVYVMSVLCLPLTTCLRNRSRDCPPSCPPCLCPGPASPRSGRRPPWHSTCRRWCPRQTRRSRGRSCYTASERGAAWDWRRRRTCSGRTTRRWWSPRRAESWGRACEVCGGREEDLWSQIQSWSRLTLTSESSPAAGSWTGRTLSHSALTLWKVCPHRGSGP